MFLTPTHLRLLGVSAVLLLAERVRPWRRQKLLRDQWLQDVFWYVFNNVLLEFVLGWLFAAERHGLAAAFHLTTGKRPTEAALLTHWPLWQQALVLLVAADLLEYLTHYGMHGIPVLWRFHRLHHSIRTMDFIGNWRFHCAEIVVYRGVKYLPLHVLGVDFRAWLIYWGFLLVFGALNHSNLNVNWGPLRYVLNSPCMHIWHHDKAPHGRFGANFGVVFSFWDWLFGTAHMPADPLQPEQLGFQGQERLPENLWWRLFLPFLDSRPPAGHDVG